MRRIWICNCLCLFLIDLGGCSPPADYGHGRQVCELATDEVIPAPFDGVLGLIRRVSDACGAHLGDALGLDWETFDDPTEGATQAETTQDALVGAVFVLISANLGTVEQTLEEPELPVWLYEAFSDLRDRFGLVEDDPAGWLWFGLVTDRIRRTRLAPDSISSGATASYDHGVLKVSDWVESPPSENVHTMNAAATLVHEAAHESQAPHRSGDEWAGSASEFDADTEGAYAAEAWFLVTWMAGLDRSDADQRTLCRHACIDCACGHIQAVDGFSPCETDLSELCAGWDPDP